MKFKSLVALLLVGSTLFAQNSIETEKIVETPIAPITPEHHMYTAEQGKAEAEAKLEKGTVSFLTYGHPHQWEYQQVKDSISNMFGFTVRSVWGDIMIDNGIPEYVEAHNVIMEKHMLDKHGPDWREVYNLKIEQVWKENFVPKTTAQELADQYLIWGQSIFYEENSQKVDKKLIAKIGKANKIGLKECDELARMYPELLGEKALNLNLSTSIGKNESKKVGLQRLENVRQLLIKAGFPEDRITVNKKFHKTFDCKDMPFDVDAMQRRVIIGE